MLAENLDAKDDEHEAADGFDGKLQFAAYEAANEAADEGEHERGQSNGKQGEAQLLDGTHTDADERDAHGKGIDAHCQ